MAKIAGRKNDGAWVRTNKDLAKLNNDEQQALETAAANSPHYSTMTEAYSNISSFITQFGLDQADWPSTVTLWLTQLIRLGIPRQIWDGVTTYDGYQKTTDSEGDTIYQKMLGPSIQKMSVWLRNFVSKWIIFNKEIVMLNNKKAPVSSRAPRTYEDRLAGYEARKLELLAAGEQLPAGVKRAQVEETPLTVKTRQSKSPVLRARNA